MYISRGDGRFFKFHDKDALWSLKTAFILANSADLDEMPRFAAFHQRLYCFTKVQIQKLS